MATARETVVRAYKELGYIDIDTTVDTLRTTLMDHGLDVLSRMMASWPAHALNILGGDLVMTGNVAAGSAVIDSIASDPDLYDTSSLHTGMYVTGTGIASGTKVGRINSPTQITLNRNAETSGDEVSLTFSDLPLDEKFEEAVITLLAVRLAPSARTPVTPELQKAARMGWNALQGFFIQVPEASFDPALVRTTNRG